MIYLIIVVIKQKNDIILYNFTKIDFHFIFILIVYLKNKTHLKQQLKYITEIMETQNNIITPKTTEE